MPNKDTRSLTYGQRRGRTTATTTVRKRKRATLPSYPNGKKKNNSGVGFLYTNKSKQKKRCCLRQHPPRMPRDAPRVSPDDSCGRHKSALPWVWDSWVIPSVTMKLQCFFSVGHDDIAITFSSDWRSCSLCYMFLEFILVGHAIVSEGLSEGLYLTTKQEKTTPHFPTCPKKKQHIHSSGVDFLQYVRQKVSYHLHTVRHNKHHVSTK